MSSRSRTLDASGLDDDNGRRRTFTQEQKKKTAKRKPRGKRKKTLVRRDILEKLCGAARNWRDKTPRQQLRILLGDMSRLIRLADNLSSSKLGQVRRNNVEGIRRSAKVRWVSAREFYSNLDRFTQNAIPDEQYRSLQAFIPLPRRPSTRRRVTGGGEAEPAGANPGSNNAVDPRVYEDVMIQMQAISQLVGQGTEPVAQRVRRRTELANQLLRQVLATATVSDDLKRRIQAYLDE